MEFILCTVILILLVMVVYEKYKMRLISKDIALISKEIKCFTDEEYCKTLLLPTENKELRELLIEINTLINFNRKEKSLRIYNENSISKMLSNVSHDLKTPLTIILGYIEIIINDNTISEGERKVVLDKINIRAKEVLDLINKFFTLAKLESGDKEIELEKINITDIAKQSILAYYDILTNENFNVEINIPENSVYALGNKEAIERILNNLISNAYKYGGSGKVIGIGIEEDKEHIIIEVFDKGIGISNKEIDKIFDRSYIGEVSRNKEVSGSGLGLSITKKLVEKMHGRIEVRSEENKKTSFIVSLNKLGY